MFAHEESGPTHGAIDGELHSGSCSGTRSLAAGELPDVLGSASAPLAGSSPVGGDWRQWRTVAVAGVLVASATLAGLSLQRRSRRRRAR